jgi:hypothetical protein
MITRRILAFRRPSWHDVSQTEMGIRETAVSPHSEPLNGDTQRAAAKVSLADALHGPHGFENQVGSVCGQALSPYRWVWLVPGRPTDRVKTLALEISVPNYKYFPLARRRNPPRLEFLYFIGWRLLVIVSRLARTVLILPVDGGLR